jgi:hypothetical protein
MRRSVALALLLTLVSSAGMLSPARDDKDKPSQAGGVRKVQVGTTPSVSIPGPGDVVGGSVLIKGSRGSCDRVVLYINPPPTGLTMPVDATISSDGKSWSYNLTGVTASFTVTACCKKDPPPNEPCSSGTAVTYQPTPTITGSDPSDDKTGKKYYAGQIELHGTYQHKEGAFQSVYVVIENFEASDERFHRSQAAKAELKDGKWRACFTNVGKGQYIVRALLVSRTDPVRSTSYYINVE